MNIKSGATRKVFVFRKFVVKVPNIQYRLFLYGILANLQERLWSGQHPDLARVLWCDPLGLVLFMEKAEIVKNNDHDGGALFKQLEAKYADDELREFLLSDCKSGNWGYIGDRLVKVDYGN
jgi:hypothetical protein